MMVKGVRYTMVGLLALLKEAVPADSALSCFAQHKAETFIWQNRPSSLCLACNKLEGCEWKDVRQKDVFHFCKISRLKGCFVNAFMS